MKLPVVLFSLFFLPAVALWGCSAEESPGSSDSAELAEAVFADFDAPPAPVHQASPRYPDTARREGLSGTAHVSLVVDETGGIRSVEIARSSGHADLDEAALAAAREWTFEPATRDGKPVPAKIVVPFEFKLQ